jgi:hypothetical protein
MESPVPRGTATCLLVGGPVDGSSCRNIPMLFPGLAPEYLDIGLGANDNDDDGEPRAMYRRIGVRPDPFPGVGAVWRYVYDAHPRLDSDEWAQQ